MKFSFIAKSMLLAFAVAIPAATFAAPASKNPQRHTQTGRFATTTTPSQQINRPTMAATDCSGCSTTTVVRRGGKSSTREQKTSCTGCPTMAAGGTCL